MPLMREQGLLALAHYCTTESSHMLRGSRWKIHHATRSRDAQMAYVPPVMFSCVLTVALFGPSMCLFACFVGLLSHNAYPGLRYDDFLRGLEIAGAQVSHRQGVDEPDSILVVGGPGATALLSPSFMTQFVRASLLWALVCALMSTSCSRLNAQEYPVFRKNMPKEDQIAILKELGVEASSDPAKDMRDLADWERLVQLRNDAALRKSLHPEPALSKF